VNGSGCTRGGAFDDAKRKRVSTKASGASISVFFGKALAPLAILDRLGAQASEHPVVPDEGELLPGAQVERFGELLGRKRDTFRPNDVAVGA